MAKRAIEPPLELPDELPASPLFDLPDDEQPSLVPAPAAAPDGPGAAADRPLEGPLAIGAPVLTPDQATLLARLEAAVAPYEQAAQAFALAMATAPTDTPAALQALGEASLFAKERETAIAALFEPAIRAPRDYLDRVYALRRRVVAGWQTGGATAATRYTAAWAALVEADRRAQAEADRRQRAAQYAAEREAAEARRALLEAATAAATQGDRAAAGELVEQARAVEAAPLPLEPVPVAVAPAAAVEGLGTRTTWAGAVVDLKEAVNACARPDLMREIADAIQDGSLTAGGQSLTTEMIATKLRAQALDLPIIPSSMFQGNPEALKARAQADHDTLHWPGFTFTQVTTPVRRGKR